MTDLPRVMVVGATGLFGELLVRRLARDSHFDVVGVARGSDALTVLQAQTSIETLALDRNSEQAFDRALNTIKPFAVVDCAGPFQYYGSQPYRFARQVLQAGSHYIDIADASEFVTGIDVLNDVAVEHSVHAISGASTAPAISAAVCDELTASMVEVSEIKTAIIPGNRARRTFSVMKAILGQIGKPFTVTRYGERETVFGWGETQRINMTVPRGNEVSNRLASLIHTPEVELFPARYQAHTVTTRAGLEIKTFHRLLQIAGKLVKSGVVSSLAPLTPTARWIASWFERCGSDIGGMQVQVCGMTAASKLVQRTWELVADDGYGPEIPTLPVSVLLHKLLQNEMPVGARHACGAVTLSELEPYFSCIAATTNQYEKVIIPVFKQSLAESFDTLPEQVQALHSTFGQSIYKGSAESKGPTGLSGRLAAWLFGFPGAADKVPVEVTITADANAEVWQRNFDGSVFKSILKINEGGYVTEQFGPITMRLGLHDKDACLYFPVVSAKLFGIMPIPNLLLPKSIAHETQDAQGRFVFDVNLLTPFGARIAHYRGWLVKDT